MLVLPWPLRLDELSVSQLSFAGLKEADQFCQALFIRLASRTVAIRLNPFRMLNAQVIMNALPELSVGMDLGSRAGSRRKIVCLHVCNLRFELA